MAGGSLDETSERARSLPSRPRARRRSLRTTHSILVALRDLHEIAVQKSASSVLAGCRWISLPPPAPARRRGAKLPSQREEACGYGRRQLTVCPTFGILLEIERPSDVALKVEIARDRLQFLLQTEFLPDARLPAHDDDRPRGPLSDRSQRPATLPRARRPRPTIGRAGGGGLPQPLEAKRPGSGRSKPFRSCPAEGLRSSRGTGRSPARFPR